MNESLFRKKSLDVISSPERVDDYLKTAGASRWLLIGTVVLLLLAAICWSGTATVERQAASAAVMTEQDG
jgi:hypothetical protein